jgi:ribonuclease R
MNEKNNNVTSGLENASAPKSTRLIRKDDVYDAIVASLDSGEAPLLDDLKSVWTSKETNRVIRDLAKKGLAGVHRRRLRKADGINYSFGEGVIEQRGPSRFLLVQDNGDQAYLTAKSSKNVVSGDRVFAFFAHEEGSDTEALPSSLITRSLDREHVARARDSSDGRVVFFLDNRVEDVPLGLNIAGATAGDLWFVKMTDTTLFRDVASAVATRRMGNEADKGIESKLAFETRFSEEAKCIEAEWPSSVSLSAASDEAERKDLRDMPLATVDGESTSDFDDAIYAQSMASGSWEVTVAIADVSAFVTVGSKLDKFARQKMTSVYLPHEVHPMLPRSLSTGVCSLNPNEERYALCCKMHVTAGGVVDGYEFFRAVIKSHARLTYDQLQSHLDLGLPALEEPLSKSMAALSSVAKALKDDGAKNGRLDMGDDEVGFVLGKDGKIESLKSSVRSWSHKIIEECMLAANRCAAEYVGKSMPLGVFRNHPGVKPEGLALMHVTLEAMGLKVGDGKEQITQAHIAEVLAEAKTIGKYSQARSAILSGMSSASYEANNKGHFSLVAPYYCHFTSPIRRYPDLVVHRLIKSLIDASPSPHAADEIQAISKTASKFSQAASQAENEARKLLVLGYAKNFIDLPLNARATTIGERGIWASLPFPGANMEFFLTARAMKIAGMQWSDDDQSWSLNGRALNENDNFDCKIVSCDSSSRRVELAPVSAPVPVVKQVKI